MYFLILFLNIFSNTYTYPRYHLAKNPSFSSPVLMPRRNLSSRSTFTIFFSPPSHTSPQNVDLLHCWYASMCTKVNFLFFFFKAQQKILISGTNSLVFSSCSEFVITTRHTKNKSLQVGFIYQFFRLKVQAGSYTVKPFFEVLDDLYSFMSE